MQFLYHPDASAEQITLDGDSHRYISKVRRHRAGETIALRNLIDDDIYLYTIEGMDRRTTTIRIVESETLIIAPVKPLHIGWCIIDPKKIEKTLPALNEIGVTKITFIHCARSQANFTPDTARLETILINSSQQCGRSQMMEIEFAKSLEDFISDNPDAYMLNFSKNKMDSDTGIETIVIGCEGGFSPDEIALFPPKHIIGLDTPTTLRSETAAMSVSSKLLL